MWDAVLDANLKSLFVTTMAVLPHGRARREDRQHRFDRGARRQPAAGWSGVRGGEGRRRRVHRRARARTRPRGATVNTVAPGYIADTRFFGESGVAPAIAATIREQTPAGRAGHPDDIADAVAWLAGPRASFVTGATIAVNGGWRVG